MISSSTVAIPSTGILAATTWMIPLGSEMMMDSAGIEMSGKGGENLFLI